jgi:carbamoyl-phosphate synthase small subunit
MCLPERRNYFSKSWFCCQQRREKHNDLITHYHINDNTVAGMKMKSKNVFVQYHPEASPGPHDSSYLF